MSIDLEKLLLEVLKTASQSGALQSQDWAAIASEAVNGCAPAQYIVATAFEKQGNLSGAKEWYERSAAQQYPPAVSKLALLKRNSAA